MRLYIKDINYYLSQVVSLVFWLSGTWSFLSFPYQFPLWMTAFTVFFQVHGQRCGTKKKHPVTVEQKGDSVLFVLGSQENEVGQHLASLSILSDRERGSSFSRIQFIFSALHVPPPLGIERFSTSLYLAHSYSSFKTQLKHHLLWKPSLIHPQADLEAFLWMTLF